MLLYTVLNTKIHGPEYNDSLRKHLDNKCALPKQIVLLNYSDLFHCAKNVTDFCDILLVITPHIHFKTQYRLQYS